MNASRKWTTAAALFGFTAATVLVGNGVANADEWPPIPNYPSPSIPFETDGFLTPTDLDYWNPLLAADRLTSPYGTSTRIVCTAFHGVLTGCWQADANGNPHRLIALTFDFPNVTGSSMPGGGPQHFVYPGFIPGIG